jgi:hypothetical protein
LTHLLKHQFQSEQRSSSWRGGMVEHRQRMRNDFEESPSPRAAEVFTRAYAHARERVSAETGLPLRRFPRPTPTPWSRRSTPSSCRPDPRLEAEVR